MKTVRELTFMLGAFALGSALARGSYNRKMTGPHRQG